jgi:hypothetical protein
MCCEHVSVVVVRPLVLQFVLRVKEGEVRSVGRAIGLDVHRDLCEVAIVESGALRSAGRIATTPEALELFGQSLVPADRVALEVTGGAWEVARILEPHVARVVVVSPADTAFTPQGRRSDCPGVSGSRKNGPAPTGTSAPGCRGGRSHSAPR